MVVKRLTYYKSNKRHLNRFSFIQVKLHNFEVFSFLPNKMHFLEAFFICPRLPKIIVQSVQSCPMRILSNKLPSGQKLLTICTNNSLLHIFWSRLGSMRYWWAILRWNCYIFCYSKKSRLHGGFLSSSSEKATQDVGGGITVVYEWYEVENS